MSETGKPQEYLSVVRDQYEDYPYPLRDPARETQHLIVPVIDELPRLNHFCFEGMRDLEKGCRTLIAGGGTGDSAISMAEQLHACGQTVTYLDISNASMAIAKQRAEIRGLKNIEWIHASILDIPKLGLGEFDYINCSGVLHHLESPEAGIAALASALKDDGAMGIMLYGKYGRMAIYLMQEMLRQVNKGVVSRQEKVDNTRKILNNLPHTHWFLNTEEWLRNDIKMGDIGIYDLLLHSHDRPYTVSDVYDFLEGAGLNLVHFIATDGTVGDRVYDPEVYLDDPALIAKVKSYPLKEQQILAELMHSKISRQIFYAAKRQPRRPGPEDVEMVPFFNSRFNPETVYEQVRGIIKNAQRGVCAFTLPGAAENDNILMRVTQNLVAIAHYMDGQRSLKEIFRAVMDNPNFNKQKPNFTTLQQEFAEMFKTLNAHNWLFLRHPSVPPYTPRITLQKRMLDRIR